MMLVNLLISCEVKICIFVKSKIFGLTLNHKCPNDECVSHTQLFTSQDVNRWLGVMLITYKFIFVLFEFSF